MEDKTYKKFIAQISFWIQESGPVQVFARDAEEAKTKVPLLLPHLKDVVVHDVFPADQIERQEPPTQAPPATPMIH